MRTDLARAVIEQLMDYIKGHVYMTLRVFKPRYACHMIMRHVHEYQFDFGTLGKIQSRQYSASDLSLNCIKFKRHNLVAEATSRYRSQ
ncbi:hypothetical protein TNCV_3693241 [Trichonephila clavipes]|nr:hypothetical protein TNCV_3693241 [Trichonephila clavipes]